MTVLLAVRCGYLADDSVELLYLTRGDSCRYRIFLSTTDKDCRERVDDLEAIEFDSIDAIDVETFLIESLWRLHLSPIEIHFVCISFERTTSEIGESVATETDGTTHSSLLLTLIERQLAALRNSLLESFMLTLIARLAVTIEALPYLSEADKTRLTSLRNHAISVLSIAR